MSEIRLKQVFLYNVIYEDFEDLCNRMNGFINKCKILLEMNERIHGVNDVELTEKITILIKSIEDSFDDRRDKHFMLIENLKKLNELNNECYKNCEDSSKNDEDSSENGDVKFRHILYYCKNCGEMHSEMFL